MAPVTETTLLRNHLKSHGYEVTSNRHTETSRAHATAGRRLASYTVTLRWPCGKVTRHNAPDNLLMAYKMACAAIPEGFPKELTNPLLGVVQPRSQQRADAPLRKKQTQEEQVSSPEMPTLF